MKIPSFEEIKASEPDTASIHKQVKKAHVGSCPTYVALDYLSQKELHLYLDNLEIVLSELGIDPKFPYPLYVISEKIHNHETFSVFPTISGLPKHFMLKSRKLKHQEISLLKKAKIKAERIRNLPISENLNSLDKAFSDSRKLFDLCKETHFYEEIFEGLHDK